MDKQSTIETPIEDWDRIREASAERAILMKNQVVPYKEYIRKIVETATVSEVNRWNDARGDAMKVFSAVPIVKRNRFLPWLILFLGIAAAYYFLTPLFG